MEGQKTDDIYTDWDAEFSAKTVYDTLKESSIEAKEVSQNAVCVPLCACMHSFIRCFIYETTLCICTRVLHT